MKNKVRINKYDNLKGFAIFLVVFAHLLAITTFNSATLIIKFVTIIHLPIFFFVSGYFSKIGSDEPIKAFKRLLIPYILFSFIYVMIQNFVGLETQPLFIYTVFGMWFLIALFMMKLALPILNKFKHPILISIIIALLTGYINIDYNILGISRFFTYMPIFLIGFYYENIKTKLNNHSKINNCFNNKRLIALIGIIILIVWIVVAIKIPINIIGLYESYNHPFEIIERLIVLILSISAVIFLNKIFTNKKLIITKIGKNSYSVYILHIFIISLINSHFIHSFLPTNELSYLTFAVITAIIIVFILSRDFITSILNNIIDFIYNIFIKDSAL